MAMNAEKNVINGALNPIHAFPSVRPDITITKSDTKLDPIKCLELQWWFAIPRLNECTMAAAYDIETTNLDIVTEIRATRQADILGIDCIEMRMDDYRATNDWHSTTNYWYCRISPDRSQWLAIRKNTEREDELYSFQNDGFQQDWGGCGEHRLVDDGRYQIQEDGSYKQLTDRKGLGAETYDVTIGTHTFRCLRVIDPGKNEHDEVGEAYVEHASGRTVLYRQYRGRLMRYNKDQDPLERLPDVRFPENPKIIIDGCVYVQCNCTGKAHDVITGTGMGIDLKA